MNPNLRTKLLFSFLGGIAVALLLGAALRDETVEKQMQEQNKQLARIAHSLEIISGQSAGWKIPK